MSLIMLIGIVVIAAIVLIFAGLSYVKAPPDQAYLISGPRKDMKIITGKAGFRIPFIDRLDKLYLGIIGVDVKTKSAVPTAEYINVFVDANVNVCVGRTPELRSLAAKNFLNQRSDIIAQKAQEVLEGNMREIVGQMKLTEMVTDRKAFAEKVMENAVPDMEKLGLEIISFNVQNFTDENSVINDLGIDNVEQIKKAAAIAKSDAKRDVAIKEADNKRSANEAQVVAATKIAEQNNALEIKQAELKSLSEVKRAAADMAYKIQEADQIKQLDVATTNAAIAQTEREVELQSQKIALKEKELDAVVRKEADAKLYAAQKQAEADLIERQKQAEAAAYEQVQKSTAAKQATELEAEARKVMAEAELIQAQKSAEGIRVKAEAEAEGIRARGLAEAEGIEKKAEAQKKMGEASVLEMAFAALPEMTKAAAEPLSKINGITIYGDNGAEKIVKDVTNVTSQVINGLAANGIDIKQLLNNFFSKENTEYRK